MAEILPQDKLLDLRKKVLAGYEPTDEEVANVLATLRAKRGNVGTGGGAKTPAQPIDLDALFDDDKKEGS